MLYPVLLQSGQRCEFNRTGFYQLNGVERGVPFFLLCRSEIGIH